MSVQGNYGGVSSTAMILVLFILLVIITQVFYF
ncbi:conserved hypothetical tiny transmembrane protein [Paenibacillaceae bacterium GAS479]|nr:conserved hypothetical tiny transmembrane protein [Paenibacillaceae bacterium GAS479]